MKNKLYVLLLVMMAVFVGICYHSVKTDDSFIYYSYVKNIVSGNGWVFNDCEKINACTSILYPMVLSIITLLFKPITDNIPMIGHIVGVIALFSMCIFLFLSLKGMVRYFVPVFIMANPLILNGFGMETFMTFAMAAGALYFYSKENLEMAALFIVFSIFSRPDMLLFAGVFYGYDLIKNKRMITFQETMIIAIPLLSWCMASYLYFGSVIPTTLTAKLCQARSGSFGTGALFLSGFNDIPYYGNIVSRNATWLIFIASVIVVLINRKKIVMDSPSSILLVWAIVHTFVYGVILNTVNFPWYYVYAVIPIAIIASFAICSLNRTVRVMVFIAITVVAFANNYYIGNHNDRSWKHRAYKRIATELKSYKPDKSVACSEIGVLKYYYGGTIVDAIGLVSQGQAEQLKSGDPTYYIKRYRPHFMVFNYPPKNITERIDVKRFGYNEIGKLSTNRRMLKIYESPN